MRGRAERAGDPQYRGSQTSFFVDTGGGMRSTGTRAPEAGTRKGPPGASPRAPGRAVAKEPRRRVPRRAALLDVPQRRPVMVLSDWDGDVSRSPQSFAIRHFTQASRPEAPDP